MQNNTTVRYLLDLGIRAELVTPPSRHRLDSDLA